MVFNATFNNISVYIVDVSFIGGGNHGIPWTVFGSSSRRKKNEKTKKYHAVRKVPKYKIRAVVVV
jgi:hypothetical protein